jgi:hypothetical protein
MKRPNVLTGIVFALAVTVLTVPFWWSLKVALPYVWAFRLALIAPYLAYCTYLLTAAQKRIGNLTLSAANLVVVLGLLSLPTSNAVIVTALVALVTLNRSILFHRSMVSFTLDGCVSAVGFSLAGYLFNSTWSMPAAIWGYFLVQSVFVMIPPRFSEVRGGLSMTEGDPVDPFQRSRRQAQAALERLINGDRHGFRM